MTNLYIMPPPPPQLLKIYGASTASHRQNYTSLYSFDCEFRRCRNSLLFNTSGIRAATEILNVSEAARMPLVPNSNKFALCKLAVQKWTRMFIFGRGWRWFYATARFLHSRNAIKNVHGCTFVDEVSTPSIFKSICFN